MKANVFSEETSDGQIRVFSPEHGIEATAPTQRQACDEFVRLFRDKYLVDPLLVSAQE